MIFCLKLQKAINEFSTGPGFDSHYLQISFYIQNQKMGYTLLLAGPQNSLQFEPTGFFLRQPANQININ